MTMEFDILAMEQQLDSLSVEFYELCKAKRFLEARSVYGKIRCVASFAKISLAQAMFAGRFATQLAASEKKALQKTAELSVKIAENEGKQVGVGMVVKAGSPFFQLSARAAPEWLAAGARFGGRFFGPVLIAITIKDGIDLTNYYFETREKSAAADRVACYGDYTERYIAEAGPGQLPLTYREWRFKEYDNVPGSQRRQGQFWEQFRKLAPPGTPLPIQFAG
jgi:hypothetical protein